HCSEGLRNGLYIRAATAFAPTDQSGVGDSLHDDIGNAVAVYPRTDLAVRIGNADWKEFKIDDLHDRVRSIGYDVQIPGSIPLGCSRRSAVAWRRTPTRIFEPNGCTAGNWP